MLFLTGRRNLILIEWYESDTLGGGFVPEQHPLVDGVHGLQLGELGGQGATAPIQHARGLPNGEPHGLLRVDWRNT